MMRENLNVILAGVGGQGVILSSTIIGEAAVEEGLSVRIAESRGLAQRGGIVVSHIRIGRGIHSPLIPKGMADGIVGFEPMEFLRHCEYLKGDGGFGIVNSEPILPVTSRIGLERYPDYEAMMEAARSSAERVYIIDGTGIAKSLGNPNMLSIVMVGALYAVAKPPISRRAMEESIRRNVPKGTEEANLKAFEEGIRAIEGY
ncbi:MAG: indolepyruvate oxidoreductase subunit beta [Candidatus Bathyarchaeia archaeon]